MQTDMGVQENQHLCQHFINTEKMPRYRQVWGFRSGVVMGYKRVSTDIRYLAFRHRAPNYSLTIKTGSLFVFWVWTPQTH